MKTEQVLKELYEHLDYFYEATQALKQLSLQPDDFYKDISIKELSLRIAEYHTIFSVLINLLEEKTK